MKYYYVIDVYERARIGDLLFVNSYDGIIDSSVNSFIELMNNKKNECIKLSCNDQDASYATAKVSTLERLE